jgi:hypothetical protein
MYGNRFLQMGMPLPNASPLLPAQPMQQQGGVTLMPWHPAPEPKSLTAGLGGQGLGAMMLAMQKGNAADASRLGPIPGIAMPQGVTDAVGSQILAASMPPMMGLDMGAATSPWSWGNLMSGLRGWFGGFGG